MNDTLEGRVRAALDDVKDPCSVATRRPLGIVEMGLLAGLEASAGGEIRIALRVTGPSCMLIGSIMRAAEERVLAIEGVRDVQIEIDANTVWTPDLMSERGREKLEAARAQTRDQLRRRAHATSR
jgi:metal-sulfur cluster biosynthetic enzyme